MYGNATCYANVLRGTAENSDGDVIQAGTAATPVYANVPFSIIDHSRRVYNPATGEQRTIRQITGRCNGDIELQEDDQIFDITHQRLYSTVTCTRSDSAITAGEWVLELQRVTGGPVTP